MRSVRVFAFAVITCLLVAGSLQAQTATGQMEWRGVNGAWSSFSNVADGSAQRNVYTSPYRAGFAINPNPNPALLPPAGTVGFGPTWDVFCVDYFNSASLGISNKWFTNLWDSQQAGHTGWLGLYTRSNSLDNYLAAAYLATRIQADPTHAGLYQGAIWHILSGTPNYYWNGSVWEDVSSTATYALTTGRLGINPRDWVVVTPTDWVPGTNNQVGQEFLTQVTPEPATLLLLGTGLVVMLVAAGAFRRPTV